jgi:hypothetical protein
MAGSWRFVRRARRWGLGLLVLGGAALPRIARAEERARLVYVRSEGAEACPDEIALRLRVVARLSYDPFSPGASRVVVARIDAVPKALLGTVELVDAQGMSSGKRELSSTPESCEELARSMALSISLAIDPDREQSPPAASPAEPEPEPAPPAPPRGREEPARAVSATPGHFFAGLAFVGAVGALPAPALGGLGSFGFRTRYFSVALEGRASWSLERELTPRGSIDGSLIGGGLSACGRLDYVGACFVALAGVQALESSGVAAAQARSATFVGLGPRLSFRGARSAHGVAFTASLEGLLSLTRNRAYFSGVEIWRSPALSGAALLGIDLPFL